MRRLLLPLLCLLALPVRAELPVTATDRGFSTSCAEMDNVLIGMENPEATRFTIRARHPAYTAGAEAPDHKADFSNCTFPQEPIWEFDLQSHVLHEDAQFRLQGHRLTRSWRPELVDVSVGERTWPGLHLLQLLVRRAEKDIEILVLYPHDGYWRAKPLPAMGHLDMPYGSSFLFGPIEVDRRPLVKFSHVRFDPATLTFTVDWVRGGQGTLRVVSAGADELRLEARMSRPVAGGPFAMLSSMFVTEDNADVGRLRSRDAGGVLWRRVPPVTFMPQVGAEFDFGRDLVSRHNTLAPDMIFGPFEGP